MEWQRDINVKYSKLHIFVHFFINNNFYDHLFISHEALNMITFYISLWINHWSQLAEQSWLESLIIPVEYFGPELVSNWHLPFVAKEYNGSCHAWKQITVAAAIREATGSRLTKIMVFQAVTKCFVIYLMSLYIIIYFRMISYVIISHYWIHMTC